MPCAACGGVALYRVGHRGFCGKHKALAERLAAKDSAKHCNRSFAERDARFYIAPSRRRLAMGYEQYEREEAQRAR